MCCRATLSLFGEHVLCAISAVIIQFTVFVLVNETFRDYWTHVGPAATYLGVLTGWSILPMAFVLLAGYFARLLHRLALPWIARAAQLGNGAVTRWPEWATAYVVEAALVSAACDLLLIGIVDLSTYHNEHWLLFPWAVVCAVTALFWSLRVVSHPRSAIEESPRSCQYVDAIGRLWDWVGEAVIAATFSSLIFVFTVGPLFFYDDPLQAEYAGFLPYALGGALTPVGLMLLRRGIASIWRNRHRISVLR